VIGDALKRCFSNPEELSRNQKTLKLLFSLVFVVQVVMAGLTGMGLMLVAPVIPISAVNSHQYIWFSLVTVFLGLAIGGFIGGQPSKSGVTAATIVGGVVLASPAWYLTLVIVSAGGPSPVAGIIGIQLIVAFGLGIVLVTFLTRAANAKK